MKNFALGLLLGIILGAALVYFATVYSGPSATEVVQQVETTGQQAQEGLEAAKTSLQAKLEALELRPEDIQQELAETGRVVRRKARAIGETVADETADARISGAVKAKLAVDPELSAWDISVSTTDREVTLTGTVDSPERVGKATLLALETEDVRTVISVLQVEPES